MTINDLGEIVLLYNVINFKYTNDHLCCFWKWINYKDHVNTNNFFLNL